MKIKQNIKPKGKQILVDRQFICHPHYLQGDTFAMKEKTPSVSMDPVTDSKRNLLSHSTVKIPDTSKELNDSNCH